MGHRKSRGILLGVGLATAVFSFPWMLFGEAVEAGATGFVIGLGMLLAGAFQRVD